MSEIFNRKFNITNDVQVSVSEWLFNRPDAEPLYAWSVAIFRPNLPPQQWRRTSRVQDFRAARVEFYAVQAEVVDYMATLAADYGRFDKAFYAEVFGRYMVNWEWEFDNSYKNHVAWQRHEQDVWEAWMDHRGYDVRQRTAEYVFRNHLENDANWELYLWTDIGDSPQDNMKRIRRMRSDWWATPYDEYAGSSCCHAGTLVWVARKWEGK